ncbi:M20 metallopeptidase family protein [Consotaella aegiceratis]|uniref:M20 metallopeptidase family protein n=1 Tax=Consotaella aegiceratis TaxID=3097961 RepID=UPI002F406A32
MDQASSLLARIDTITEEITPALVAIRRRMHENPELGFEEYETSAMIQGELDRIGLSWKGGFGKTGIAATTGAGSGRTVGMRSDFDALPIEETGNPPYKSRNPGRMHACGHDAHTAIAIGVAEVMARLSNELPGRAFMIFQPAEEGLGGARAMIDDGLLDWMRPDLMLGFHNWPLIPAGTIGYHPGTAFASTDPFDIEIRGKSGHGAHPHLARDPIVAAGSLVAALQTIVSREIAPLSPAVLTVGAIHGGTARNQIPDVVRCEGTTRAQDPAVRDTVRAAIQRVCRGIAEVHGVEVRPIFHQGVPPVVNDSEILEPVLAAVEAQIGPENVMVLPQGSMGSEDYAEFSTRFPSAHLRIGSRLEGHETMLHRSDFDLDERCIPTGVRAMAAAMIRMMAPS